jgi:class 3 adenylate cyclase
LKSNRRLAAVLAADVVGYSRLMAADEAGTLAALKRHREVIFDPAVIAHNGRNVKLIGDGVIAEFGSVVDAVKCALSVQRSGASRQGQKAEQPTIVVRIGINLGDVMIEGDDIFGDGVNIAARLEPLAEPGGICVSSIVNGSVGNRIDARFQDSGNISVRISTDRYESGNGNRARRSRPSPVPSRLNQGRTAPLRRSLSCRSPTCRGTRNRSTSQTGSAKTLSPTCQRLPA